MLALQLQTGQYLELFPATAVTLNWTSPVFDRESFERTYVFPFRIPASAHNKKLLDFQHRLDAGVNRYKYDAVLYIAGNRFTAGIIEITDSTPREYEIVFKSRSIELAEQLKRLRIAKALDYEIEVTPEYCPDEIWQTVYDTDSEVTQFFIFQVNEDIFEANVPNVGDLVTAINAVYPDLAEEYIIADPDPDFAIAGVRIKRPGCSGITVSTAAEPEPELYYNFSFRGFDNTDAEEEITTDWTDYLEGTLTGDSEVRFPVVKMPNLYGEKNPAWLGYANYYLPDDPGAYPFNPASEEQQWQYTLIPLFTVQAVLAQIADLVSGISAFTGEFIDDVEMTDLLVSNNRPLDRLITDLDGNIINLPPSAFNMRNHLPDITAHDFLTFLGSTFCLYFAVVDGRMQAGFCRTLIAKAPINWTNKAEQDYRKEIPELQAFTLDYDRQGDETDLPPQLQRTDGGVDATDFISKFYTLHYLEETDPVAAAEEIARDWIIPLLNEEGISDIFGLSAKTSARLLFWRGMQPSTPDGFEYPFASHATANAEGDPAGEYSLDWNGEAGLYNNFWKEYIALITEGRIVKKAMRLTPEDLRRLRELEVTRVRIYHPEGELIGVVKSVQVQISTEFGMHTAQMEIVRQ